MVLLRELKKAGQNRVLAISQSGENYYYLNWVPSEAGPMVILHGSIKKALEHPDKIEEHYYEVLDEIFSYINNRDSICTFSLDSENVLFSTCYTDNNSEQMINWHLNQSRDEALNKIIDYYHYSFESESGRVLNIGIPKTIRQSFKKNMSLFKSKINGISVGIFSAEVGARQWMHAHKYESYLIWKIGKKKNDELLYVNNKKLSTYFSFHRSEKKNKINWQFGDRNIAEKICQDMMDVKNQKAKKFRSANQVYLYTTDGNMKDVKYFNGLGIQNLNLLNPFLVLETAEDEKIHEYNTLAFAETGNSFGGIDV